MARQDIDETELGQRVARLEGRLDEDEKSLSKRLSMWGGLLALIISIMIGGFQIYEYTVLRYESAREANIIQLGTYIRRISELNGKIASTMLLADTPDEQARANTESKIINTEKHVVVRLADRLLREQPSLGGFASHITMTYEMLSQGDNSSALSYASLALRNSRNKPEEIESMRYIARVLFAPGKDQDLITARQTFKKAKTLSQTETSFLRTQLIAGTFSDLIVAEIYFGDCEMAVSAVQELRSKFSSKTDSILFKSTMSEIGYKIRGTTRCNQYNEFKFF